MRNFNSVPEMNQYDRLFQQNIELQSTYICGIKTVYRLPLSKLTEWYIEDLHFALYSWHMRADTCESLEQRNPHREILGLSGSREGETAQHTLLWFP